MEKITLSKKEHIALDTQRVEYLSRSTEWMNHMSAMTTLIPSDMEAIFGKCCFIYTAEYRVKCWCFKHEDKVYVLCTAPRRGMTIESTETDPDLILDFLKELLKPFYAFEKVKVWLNRKK